MAGGPPERLGRFEVLGAWLRIWTPPRGVEVPPVPWRRIAAGTVVLLALAGGGAALAIPRIAEERREREAREAREAQRKRAEFLAYLAREQRPRTARGVPDRRGDAPGQRRAVRTALIATAQDRIAADARERTGKSIKGVDCSPFPSSLGDVDQAADLSRPAAAYDCVAVTARFGSESSAGGQGVVGIPFRLVARFRAGTLAWCRIVPLSDRDRLTRRLPRACRLPDPA